MKELKLRCGTLTQIDDDIYEKYKDIAWFLLKKRVCYSSYSETKRTKFYQIHRLILGIDDPKILVDHIDGNPLNNQRTNLRIATHSQNSANLTKINKNNTSGFRGVSWNKEKNKWDAQSKFKGKKVYLGRYSKKEEAAKKVDEYLIQKYGKYCGYLNFPIDINSEK